MSRVRIDLTGKKFGRLVVLSWVGGPSAKWSCRCECGAVKDIPGSGLRTGRTLSCGCLRREAVSARFRLPDLTGQVFGRLEVTGFAGMRDGESFVTCACICGKQVEVRGWMLRDGSTKSCGCLHRERVRAHRTDAPTYSAIHSRLRAERGHANLLPCADCGVSAEQWSYDHADESEQISPLGHPYSVSLNHYEPRCLSCHRLFDLAHGGINA